MNSSVKPSNPIRLKPIGKGNLGKPSKTTNGVYSGVISAQRSIQQQKPYALLSSSNLRRSCLDRKMPSVPVNSECSASIHYHEWNRNYHKLVIREKRIKPMTKDPYNEISRLTCNATEHIVAQTECIPALKPATAVKVNSVTIKQIARGSVPKVVRYVRRNELMPSEQAAKATIPMKNISTSKQSQCDVPIIGPTKTNRIHSAAPHLVTNERLLNRPKIQNNGNTIRRPPRKLLLNVTHETVLPLTVYG